MSNFHCTTHSTYSVDTRVSTLWWKAPFLPPFVPFISQLKSEPSLLEPIKWILAGCELNTFTILGHIQKDQDLVSAGYLGMQELGAEEMGSEFS